MAYPAGVKALAAILAFFGGCLLLLVALDVTERHFWLVAAGVALVVPVVVIARRGGWD